MAEVATEEIPEVMDFMSAEEVLEAHTEQFADVFRAYYQLVEERNQKLDAADKAIRARGVSCGPWKIKHTTVKIDWKSGHDILGRDRFLADVGGEVSTISTYKGNKEHAKVAVKLGKVTADEALGFISYTPVYSAPKKIVP